MNPQLAKLNDEIRITRATLNALAHQVSNICDPAIVHVSQLLDIKINQYYKLLFLEQNCCKSPFDVAN